MMVKKMMDARRLLLAVLVCAAMPAWASLATDVNAYNDGVTTWQGSFELGTVIEDVEGTIEYAVFEADYYNSTYSDLVELEVGGGYVYAYQIFTQPESMIPIDFFSVGIRENVAVADVHVNPFLGVTGGIGTQFLAGLEASVLYVFREGIGGEGITERSQTLVFSSDTPPGLGFAVISGGFFAGEINGIVTPIPEPATIALLTGGCVLCLRNRKKSTL